MHFCNFCLTLLGDVAVVAETGESILASCVAFGSPAPQISWMVIQDGNTSAIQSGTDSMIVFSKQSVRNGVGIVYSSLLLCPTHAGTLMTSHISCVAENGISGSNNLTSHSFIVNVSGIYLYSIQQCSV